ncbi:MAG: peptidase P60 [Betaproteobacteria bacterium]|nr:peptidase P60 [Betaproteobacteria bacterium]
MTAANSAGVLAALALLMGGCTLARPPLEDDVTRTSRGTEVVAPAPVSPGARAARAALEFVGTRYRFGGTLPSGFDCSGLVRHAYGMVGIDLPRDTRHQRSTTRLLTATDRLRQGDLLFFRRGPHSAGLHVGLYIGANRFVHAAFSRGGVRIDSLDAPYWRTTFLESRRPPAG